MDHIHSLLIMEDDLDEDTESTPDMASASPITAQTSAEGPGPSSGTSLPWCKCGTCQVMPQELKINVVGKGDVSQIIQDFKISKIVPGPGCTSAGNKESWRHPK